MRVRVLPCPPYIYSGGIEMKYTVQTYTHSSNSSLGTKLAEKIVHYNNDSYKVVIYVHETTGEGMHPPKPSYFIVSVHAQSVKSVRSRIDQFVVYPPDTADYTNTSLLEIIKAVFDFYRNQRQTEKAKTSLLNELLHWDGKIES